MTTPWSAHTAVLNGLETHFLEAGQGPPLVLLHGGEFGASAELGWEAVIESLAEGRRVVAPDILGFGRSAKVVDFVDGRGWRLRHLAALCDHLEIIQADFIGNSMGGAMLIADAASPQPVLPMRTITSVCGGGEVADNQHMAALLDYDATSEGMRRVVEAMFADPRYARDEAYVRRRFESATLPGAWESVASARFRRPGHTSSASTSTDHARITQPTLVVEGADDKLKPSGWGQRLADLLPNGTSAVVADAGHCPQIEQPEQFVRLIDSFLTERNQ